MDTNNPYSYCNVLGDTNVGCRRPENEDWWGWFDCENGRVTVVCDGMGGHVGGKVASHLAVDTIRDFLTTNYFADPRQAIVEACNAANNAILQRTAQERELTGMGATCVMVIIRDGKVYLGSVGDSRIYLIRSKKITQLTKDQSYVQTLVDSGQITPEQAEHHPRKNEILNALGLATMKPATVKAEPIDPEAGDCFLLCSDGLSGMVSDHDILKVASNQKTVDNPNGLTQQQRVDTLINRARDNGGHDNITCVIVEFSATPNGEPAMVPAMEKTQFLRIGLIALAALIVVCVGGICLWKLFHKDSKDNPAAPITHEICNDTILYQLDKESIFVEQDINNGAYIVSIIRPLGDTLKLAPVVTENIHKDSVSIIPSDYFRQTFVGGNLIVFTPQKEITINDSTYAQLLIRVKDSTFLYKFFLDSPEPDTTGSDGLEIDLPTFQPNGVKLN